MVKKGSKNKKLVLPKKSKKSARQKVQKKRPKKIFKLLRPQGLEEKILPTTPPFQMNGIPLSESSIKRTISNQYGDNKIVLLVRDPWWLFAYWEVTAQREEEVRREIEHANLKKEKTVLRVYDTTGTNPEKANAYFDIELNFFADQWYIDVGSPNRDWVVDIGIRTTQGRFFTLARSNRVRTPRFGPSDVLDEEWMLPEDITLKIFGLSGLGSRGAASLDFRKLWGLWGRSSDLNRKNLTL